MKRINNLKKRLKKAYLFPQATLELTFCRKTNQNLVAQ